MPDPMAPPPLDPMAPPPLDPMAPPPLDVDVLVVGAGLSGVDVACRLSMRCPGTAWAVLEARDAVGGTWDLFRYPGIRSDSDMYTLGFPFRPWRGPTSIASGEQIRQYVDETAHAYGVTARIHHGHRVERLEWSSDDARWTVTARTSEGLVRHRARLVYLATGYFAYDRGHVVDFPGREDFAGVVVHPQHWPQGMPVAGRRVVVIGSGATAVTLLPALVDAGAAHVTMLQRSPGYVTAVPSRDVVADGLRRMLPDAVAHRVVRGKNVVLSTAGYQFLRRYPLAGRRLLRRRALRSLPEGYAVDTHFAPKYDPWDQRLCVAADGDLFDVLSDGRAEVLTDTVERFERDGIRLASGEHLPADVVVTATGLRIEVAGGAEVVVDGELVDLSRRYVYKGVMVSGVPNLAMAVGYTNASWTLRADLSARWSCSLVRFMDRHGYTVATPRYDEADPGDRPVLDLTSGYVQRAAHLLPRQGRRRPWRVVQSYLYDLAVMRLGRIDDGRLELRRHA
ncbi:NAD(P)/FAD-dependent oxidoreductase [Fodinibacter luteus]|uniref:flavin-containing monooxygenase n=1 Tax=Fodinibacter luteus TaxID=552064 RepID=UPI0031E52338